MVAVSPDLLICLLSRKPSLTDPFGHETYLIFHPWPLNKQHERRSRRSVPLLERGHWTAWPWIQFCPPTTEPVESGQVPISGLQFSLLWNGLFWGWSELTREVLEAAPVLSWSTRRVTLWHQQQYQEGDAVNPWCPIFTCIKTSKVPLPPLRTGHLGGYSPRTGFLCRAGCEQIDTSGNADTKGTWGWSSPGFYIRRNYVLALQTRKSSDLSLIL